MVMKLENLTTAIGDLQGISTLAFCSIFTMSSYVQVPLAMIPVADGLIPVPIPITVEQAFLGSLITRAHNVRGDVYALDNKTLMLTGFFYDGSAPGESSLAYVK